MVLISGDSRPLKVGTSRLLRDLRPAPRCSRCSELATSMCAGVWLCLAHYHATHWRDRHGRLFHALHGDNLPKDRGALETTSWNPQ